MSRPGSGLLELLTARGVPETGARLYLAACREGPQTARELARVSALNRVEAYRFIRQLESSGLLRATPGRPMRFAAVPPGELLERWIQGTSDELRRLEANKERILRAWQESLSSVEEHESRKFMVLEGTDTISRFLKKRIGVARQEVMVAMGGSWLPVMIDIGVDRTLREAHARGVRVRIVTEISAFNISQAKHFAQFAELRHSTIPVTNRLVVVDRRGTLVFVSGEEGLGRTAKEQVALWSTTPMYLGLSRDYHKRLWGPGVASAERMVELEVPEHELVLPVGHGPEVEPFQRLREIASIGMRATGIRELRLRLPDLIDAVASQLGRQIADGVEGTNVEDLTRELRGYYEKHALGALSVAKDRPLVLKVTGCFACTEHSPEVGRVLCPRMLQTVFEGRLGGRWAVSKPDTRRHATRGCLFALTPA